MNLELGNMLLEGAKSLGTLLLKEIKNKMQNINLTVNAKEKKNKERNVHDDSTFSTQKPKNKDYNIVYRNKPTKPLTVSELFGIPKKEKKTPVENKEEKIKEEKVKEEKVVKKEEVKVVKEVVEADTSKKKTNDIKNNNKNFSNNKNRKK